MNRKCIAFREGRINGHVVYTPCPIRVRERGSRFCLAHEQAYRELVLAIILNGNGRRK